MNHSFWRKFSMGYRCARRFDPAAASCYVGGLLLAWTVLLEATRESRAETPAVGMEQRVAWTTSRVKGSPEPPLPYVTEPAFPALKFNQCLDLAAMPGGDRWFVLEERGKLFSFANKSDVKAADLVIDLAKPP